MSADSGQKGETPPAPSTDQDLSKVPSQDPAPGLRDLPAELWPRVEALLDGLLLQPSNQQQDWLQAQLEGEPNRQQLEAHLHRLLAASGRSEGFLDRPLVQLSTAEVEELPRRCGPYRLLERIGQGGMGTVYLAERADGAYEQRLAVKVMDHRRRPSEEQRFQLERQTLALLNHPNIARLYDGGSAEDGRPFLAMELVDDALPIDQYCQRHDLSLRQRVELFIRVLDAVHCAHGRSIVHRDLKPSNVLVDGSGQPKLVDFGIAKALGSVAPGVENLTGDEASPMTVRHASPEQLRGEPATVASDLYALGLLFYRLITGLDPHGLAESASLQEIVEKVCTGSPERPSRAVANLAQGLPAERGKELKQLSRQLRGDLDTILLAALRREPERRYASARELAQELERHLDRRPITARSESGAYLLSRLIQRNPIPVLLGLCLLLLAAVFAVVSTHQARDLRQQRALAQDRQQTAETTLGMLVEMFQTSDPSASGGPAPDPRRLLAAGAERANHELAGRPELQATLLNTIGNVQFNLGAFDDAQRTLGHAVALQQTHLQPGHPQMAEGQHQLARLQLMLGDLEEAEQRARSALEQRQALGPEYHEQAADSALLLARVFDANGRFQESMDLAETVLVDLRVSSAMPLPSSSPSVVNPLLMARTLEQIAEQAIRVDQLERAKAAATEALALRRAVQSPHHPDQANALQWLAQVETMAGRPFAAAPYLEEALSILEPAVEPGHPRHITLLNALAVVKGDTNDRAEEIRLHREVLALKEQHWGTDHPNVAETLANLAVALQMTGQIEEAMGHFERAWHLNRSTYGEEHFATGLNLINLGICRMRLGDFARAEDELRKALTIVEREVPAHHRYRARALFGLGWTLLEQERYAETIPIFEQVIEIRKQVLAPGHWRVAEAQLALARSTAATGQCDAAHRLAKESADALRSANQPLPKPAQRILSSFERIMAENPLDSPADPQD